jgi:hypothetical protein
MRSAESEKTLQGAFLYYSGNSRKYYTQYQQRRDSGQSAERRAYYRPRIYRQSDSGKYARNADQRQSEQSAQRSHHHSAKGAFPPERKYYQRQSANRSAGIKYVLQHYPCPPF